MSKTLAVLKHLNEQKIQEYEKSKKKDSLRAKTISFWIISVILISMFFVLMSFDRKLFTMVKVYSSESAKSAGKLDNIEIMLTDHSVQTTAHVVIIKKLANLSESMQMRINATQDNLEQLKKTTDTQIASLQALMKDKNILFEKVNLLKSDIDKLKMEIAINEVSNSGEAAAKANDIN